MAGCKSTYSAIPPRALNGGLYTGEPFQKDAPWRNFPAVPDAGYLTHVNLRSAQPPPGATTQFSAGLRPGNNEPRLPGVQVYSDQHAVLCAPPCPPPFAAPGRFAQHAYLDPAQQ